MALLATLFSASPAHADSWPPPHLTTYYSANRAVRLIVTPHIPADHPWGAELLRGPRAADVARAELQQRDRRGRWHTQWQGPLRNEIMPVSALVADSGRYFVTFDDWFSNGHGPNVLVVYDGAGRMIRALSITDLLPQDYVRTLPASCCSIFWAGTHRFSADGETLLLQLALPGWGMTPSGYFEYSVALAAGQPATRSGPEWERAMAAAANWRVMARGRRARIRALRLDPILPPRSNDPQEWDGYFTEMLQRLVSGIPGVPRTILFRGPGLGDWVTWQQTPRTALLGPDLSRYMAIAALDGIKLAPRLASIVGGHRPGWLEGASIYVVAEASDWPELLRVMGPSGATLIRIDPATPIPQRPERRQEYLEQEAALTPAESTQD